MGDSPDKPGSLSGGGEGDHQTSPSGSPSSAGDQQGQGRTLMDCNQPQEEEEEGGASSSDLAVDQAQKEPSTPTREDLLEEVKALKKEVGTLKKRLKRAKQIFGNEWDRRHQKWERMEAQLQALKEKQGKLEKTVETLKKTLGHTGREISLKMEQIQLLAKLAKLKAKEVKSGKVMKSTMLDKQVEVEDAGSVVAVRRKDAEAILPEEVWKMIFGNVQDPKDLWNLCNTCHLFDAILSKWKTGWLLGQALPNLYRHLPKEKLLGSRLVCKSWRETVDGFLQEHPSLRTHDPDNSDPRRLDFVNPVTELKVGEGYKLSFSSSSDMSLFEDPAFLEKWKKSGLIGKGLTLLLGRNYDWNTDEEREKSQDNENAEGGFEQMWTKFQEFLKLFGKEVWHLSISYFLNSPDEVDPWEKELLPFLMEDLFHCFPNIRNLRIRNKNAYFEEEFSAYTVPPALKLESLELSCVGVDHDPMMLGRYRSQLRKLNLSTVQWGMVNDLDWPNLTELHINYFEDMEDFQCLLGVGPRMPQLSKLGIHLAEGWQPDTGRILQIIRELCVSTRLNTLRLEGGFREMRMGGVEISYDPDIAQIKTLEFNHYTDDGEDEDSSASDYAFLLRCFPLLENLNVFVRRHPSYYNRLRTVPTAISLEDRRSCEELRRPLKLGTEQEIVEVSKYIYEGGMYKSNIWEVMPLLKVFSFQWDVFTREGYVSYKNKLDKKN